jgi:hypothetical protein
MTPHEVRTSHSPILIWTIGLTGLTFNWKSSAIDSLAWLWTKDFMPVNRLTQGLESWYQLADTFILLKPRREQ